MRVAISTPNFGDPNALVDAGIEADRAGWDAYFLWDHVVFIEALHLPIVDPWTVLGAVAHQTRNVRLGALVTPLPRRRPQVVAKQLTTLDHLSNGRAIFGAGLGWPSDDEFRRFGEDADDIRRAQVLDESLAVLDAFLRGGPVTFNGRHLHVDSITLEPRPVQAPRPPIWIAAMWPARPPIRRAVLWDGIVPMRYVESDPQDLLLTPDDLAAIVAMTSELRHEAGRTGPFDVVVAARPGIPTNEYEQAGATWLVHGPDPAGGIGALREMVSAGPPR